MELLELDVRFPMYRQSHIVRKSSIMLYSQKQGTYWNTSQCLTGLFFMLIAVLKNCILHKKETLVVQCISTAVDLTI